MTWPKSGKRRCRRRRGPCAKVRAEVASPRRRLLHSLALPLAIAFLLTINAAYATTSSEAVTEGRVADLLTQLRALRADHHVPSHPQAPSSGQDGEACARAYLNSLRAAVSLPPLRNAREILGDGKWRVYYNIWQQGPDGSALASHTKAGLDLGTSASELEATGATATVRFYVRIADLGKQSARRSRPLSSVDLWTATGPARSHRSATPGSASLAPPTGVWRKTIAPRWANSKERRGHSLRR